MVVLKQFLTCVSRPQYSEPFRNTTFTEVTGMNDAHSKVKIENSGDTRVDGTISYESTGDLLCCNVDKNPCGNVTCSII